MTDADYHEYLYPTVHHMSQHLCKMQASTALRCSYLMNTEVGIRVKIVIPGGHLIGVEELGHLSSAGAAG